VGGASDSGPCGDGDRDLLHGAGRGEPAGGCRITGAVQSALAGDERREVDHRGSGLGSSVFRTRAGVHRILSSERGSTGRSATRRCGAQRRKFRESLPHANQPQSAPRAVPISKAGGPPGSGSGRRWRSRLQRIEMQLPHPCSNTSRLKSGLAISDCRPSSRTAGSRTNLSQVGHARLQDPHIWKEPAAGSTVTSGIIRGPACDCQGRKPGTDTEFPAQFAGNWLSVPGFAPRDRLARSSCPRNGQAPTQTDLRNTALDQWYNLGATLVAFIFRVMVPVS
jgi:hypothetical protein